MDQTVVEPWFIEKFELHAGLAWQMGIAAARDDRRLDALSRGEAVVEIV